MNRSRLAVALGVVVLLLGSCSDDPRPKVAPATHAPTVTDSPSAEAPVLDPVETVDAWIDAQNQALRTGDTARLRDLSADPCRACDDFINPIEKVYADGGRFTTRGWRVVKARQRPSRSIPRVVDTAVSIAGGKTILTAGGAPVVYPAEKHMMVFKVVPHGTSWAVSFIGFLS